MTRHRAITGIFVVLFVMGCSSHSPSTMPLTDAQVDEQKKPAAAEQHDGVCPNPSTVLNGTKQPGAACSAGSECAPSCCPCNNGTNRSWLAVHCASGVCASVNQTCADTSNPAGFCDVQ